jgi:cell shape-determining protein MreC
MLLAIALFLAPDGAFQAWRLRLRGAFARLEKPPDPRLDASRALYSTDRDLLDILAQKNAEIADLRRRLAELGVSRDALPKSSIIPARVIGLGPEDNLDSFTIDAGTLDGVAPGQAVVVGRALAGVVARSEPRASLVLSLSSPGCYISARLGEAEGSTERPRTLGALRGAGGGKIKAIIFFPESPAREGWLAMTSGLEKGIPAGLILGHLAERFSKGGESGTMEAELNPGTELGSLDFVAVVMDQS